MPPDVAPTPLPASTAAGIRTVKDLELGLRMQHVPESVVEAAVLMVRSGIALAETEARIAEVRAGTDRINAAFDREAVR